MKAYLLRFIFALTIVTQFVPLIGQESKIDSLKNLLITKKDKAKVDILIELIYALPSGDVDGQLKYANQALELSEKTNYIKGKGLAIYMQAWYYFRIANHDVSSAKIKSATEILLEHGDSIDISNCYRVSGFISTDISNYSDAQGYLQKALAYLPENKHETKHEILESIGIAQYNLSNYNASLETFLDVLKYHENNENISAAAHLQSMIANIYIETGEKELGLVCLKKALAIGYKEKESYILGESLLSIGEYYKDENKLDSAILYLNDALKHALITKSNLLITDAYAALGETHILLNNYDSAEINFIKALEVSEKAGDNWAIVYANIGLAKVYKGEKNYGKALLYLDKVRPKAVKINSKEMLKDLYEIFSEIYALSGKHKDAYSFQLLYKNISDSLYNENMSKEIANLKVTYETEKKVEENKRLIAENELKEKSITQQKYISLGVATILLLAIILAFVFFRTKEKIRGKNSLLKERNLEIQNQNEEITVQAEELSIAYSKLQELDEFKQGLTNMIVHDLKNPLGIILNLSESRLVKEAGNKMLNLIINILDVSKFEEAKMKINYSVFELGQAIEQSIKKTSFVASISGIKIVEETENNIKVRADYDLIERVFINLLTNAIKYSPKNEKIYISAKNDTNDKFIKITVKDSGSGIPEEFIEKIFDKFTQVTAINSETIRSTGLGLTFCKLAVEAQGGKIGVKSESKKGSTFWFTLPKA